MKVKRMIEELKKFDENAEVKMHHRSGDNALFVVAYENIKDVVVIEDRTDNDLRSELSARIEYAMKNDIDELDFCMDLLETGFTLKDIEESIPEHYEYFQTFMMEHGLI